jgi:hypothetical protein
MPGLHPALDRKGCPMPDVPATQAPIVAGRNPAREARVSNYSILRAPCRLGVRSERGGQRCWECKVARTALRVQQLEYPSNGKPFTELHKVAPNVSKS